MGAAADVLGYFPTEKQALDELAKLFHAYKDGETVYEMKEIGE